MNIGDFKLYLITTESLLDEVVKIPQYAINRQQFAAHFYVVLEVLEEQEQVIIRGFISWDKLDNYISRIPLQEGYYQLPLSALDPEPNHLVFCSLYTEPDAISLAVASAERQVVQYVQETKTKLSQWLQGVFDQGWQGY